MFANAEPVVAQIKATSGLTSIDPPAGPSSLMRFLCDVYTKDGVIRDWQNLRAFGPHWPDRVLCAAPDANNPEDSIVGGVSHNGDVYLFFSPKPLLGDCATGGGDLPYDPIDLPPGGIGAPMPGSGVLRPVRGLVATLLMNSTEAELSMLKRALEAVQ